MIRLTIVLTGSCRKETAKKAKKEDESKEKRAVIKKSKKATPFFLRLTNLPKDATYIVQIL